MMNHRFLPAVVILSLLFVGTKSTYAQGVKEAMQQKVAYSQQVLVGITMEDYGLIANNAEKLVELSNKRTGIRAKCRNTNYSSTNFAATPRS